MTTKLNRIKSALRESIEIASKARLNRVDVGPFSTEQQKADAAFDMNAQKMTPLACKALLTAIEGLESMIHDPEYGDEMCDNDGRGCRACGTAFNTLSSITSKWPDV